MKPQVNFWMVRTHDECNEEVVPVTLLEYSGDSYRDKATVMFEDGTTVRVKLGWLSRRPFDPKTYNKFRCVDARQKHRMEGKRPETYKSREVKTKWNFAWGASNNTIAGHPSLRYEFDTLAEAIHGAQVALLATGGEEIELFCDHKTSNKRHSMYDSRNCWVVVYNDGNVIRYTNKRHDLSRLSQGDNMSRGTYLKGFGSGKNERYMPKRVYWGGKRRNYWRTV